MQHTKKLYALLVEDEVREYPITEYVEAKFLADTYTDLGYEAEVKEVEVKLH